MNTSIIINTCALGAYAHAVVGSDGHGGLHAWRAYVLRNWIIPMYTRWPTELIIVGEWEPGPGYIYIPCRGETLSCVNALVQRQAGFEVSTGDIIVCQHDDHVFDGLTITAEALRWDVISPRRHTYLRTLRAGGEWLNDGSRDGYILGHGAIYKRQVLERCPWKDVPLVYSWDEAHTQQIRAAGFTTGYAPDIVIRDVEPGGKPWD